VGVVVPAHLNGFPAPHALLALSTGLSGLINATLLYRGLRKQGVYATSPQLRRLLPQVAFAGVAMAGFLWWASGDWSAWTAWRATARAVQLAICICGGAGVYFLVLWLAGARPRDLKSL
jgi:putative peptidoglycan lipid II flippase